jgi:hypothetical protein
MSKQSMVYIPPTPGFNYNTNPNILQPPIVIVQPDAHATGINDRKKAYNREYYHQRVKPKKESEYAELIGLRSQVEQLNNQVFFLKELVNRYQAMLGMQTETTSNAAMNTEKISFLPCINQSL